MDAIKEYLRAVDRLEHGEITLDEYEELCKPLRDVRENVHEKKYAGSKEGSEESDILNNGCWSRLKDALSDIESNEKEKSYFKVEGAKMVVEPKDYDLCKEECDYHFEECSDGHKNIIFTLNGKIKENTGISRIQIRLDKCNLEEVVDAEWKEKNSHTRYCSACGFEETRWRTDEYKRCPNCGAKIRESKIDPIW